MGRCCDGKNAFKPITKTRYLSGLILFYILHLQCRIFMFIRHTFIKKYSHYKTLGQFYDTYFKDTLSEIKEKKGLVVKNQNCPKE